MKILTLLCITCLPLAVAAQKKQCHCDGHPDMNENTVNCATTVLKNGAKLYWQFNCDAIWLTLEQKNGRKTIVDRVDTSLSNLTYRVGYFLFKEGKNTITLRGDCPANGPCMIRIIDKNTGRKLKEYPEREE